MQRARQGSGRAKLQTRARLHLCRRQAQKGATSGFPRLKLQLLALQRARQLCQRTSSSAPFQRDPRRLKPRWPLCTCASWQASVASSCRQKRKLSAFPRAFPPCMTGARTLSSLVPHAHALTLPVCSHGTSDV